MPYTGFHSEWITEGQHRILLECRASFPNETMRCIAKTAAAACDLHTNGRARVVHVFYDDKACIWTATIASTDPKDKSLEDTVTAAILNGVVDANYTTQVEIVGEGNTQSDHYDRMEHLSVSAGIAVDRWRHRDEEYTRSVQPPA